MESYPTPNMAGGALQGKGYVPGIQNQNMNYNAAQTAGLAVAEPPKLLETHKHDLLRVLSKLQELDQRFYSLADRLMGPQPCAPSPAGTGKEECPTTIGEIGAIVNSIERSISSIADSSERLNRVA